MSDRTGPGNGDNYPNGKPTNGRCKLACKWSGVRYAPLRQHKPPPPTGGSFQGHGLCLSSWYAGSSPSSLTATSPSDSTPSTQIPTTSELAPHKAPPRSHQFCPSYSQPPSSTWLRNGPTPACQCTSTTATSSPACKSSRTSSGRPSGNAGTGYIVLA